MAECNQHYRFISGYILQTRRDQKRFYQKSRPTITCCATSAPIIACWCHSKKKSGNKKDVLNISFLFYNNGWSTSSFLKSRRRWWDIYGLVKLHNRGFQVFLAYHINFARKRNLVTHHKSHMWILPRTLWWWRVSLDSWNSFVWGLPIKISIEKNLSLY